MPSGSGECLDEVERSVIDLRMLRSPMDDGTYFATGVPWFATLFGRDSRITAIEMRPRRGVWAVPPSAARG